jgi:Kef-type K+ transport system membrane component KefB
MQPALQLALLLAILLPATKIAASLFTRFGIPPILGELLVGVALGPGAFNLLQMHVFHAGEATGALMLLAQVGAMVLMFVAGIETDIDRMREASLVAFLVALSGVIWPFFLGAGVGHLFGLSWKTACFIGGALTATSVSISARTLMDAGKMATPEATIILGAAVIDDVMGLSVLAFLAASSTSAQGEPFGFAPMASSWLQHRVGFAASHPLIVQMAVISFCVTVFFLVGYGVAKRWLVVS